MTSIEEREELKEIKPPSPLAGDARSARWSAAGVPTEKSKNFSAVMKRLGRMLVPESPVITVIVIVAVASATLNVFGPKVLGHATDLIVKGVTSHHGINFTDLHNTLFTALGLYVGSALLTLLAGYLLAGVIQRLMRRLRAMVED